MYFNTSPNPLSISSSVAALKAGKGAYSLSYEVLKAQLDRYPSLQNNVEFLSKFSTQNRNVDLAGRIVYNDRNVEVFNFGKYKGMAVSEVFARDPGYYNWMMQGDFPLDTKNIVTRIRMRMMNTSPHK